MTKKQQSVLRLGGWVFLFVTIILCVQESQDYTRVEMGPFVVAWTAMLVLIATQTLAAGSPRD